jgi:hypothetical protein
MAGTALQYRRYACYITDYTTVELGLVSHLQENSATALMIAACSSMVLATRTRLAATVVNGKMHHSGMQALKRD